MNCNEYRDIVSAHVDGTLSEQEEAEVRAHLDTCDPCTRIFDWERKATEALRHKLSVQTADPRVKTRILQALEKESQGSLLSWPANPYWLAATAALLLLGMTSLLVTRTTRPDNIFAEMVAQHQQAIDGAVPVSSDALPQHMGSALDLRPWGYRLLAQRPTQHQKVKGTTFFYASRDKEYVLAQEIEGGTLPISPGVKSISALGKIFVSYNLDGVNFVAWKDKDLLCILAAKLPEETLLQLAERLVSTA